MKPRRILLVSFLLFHKKHTPKVHLLNENVAKGLPSPHLAPETQSIATTPAAIPLPSASGAPSPPFIPADSTTLGFPVFSHPIVPPKIHLGTFPKVTSFFAPINGGDSGPFPRKEKVRNWTFQEKGIVGVGGGVMKYKSWARGVFPSSSSSSFVSLSFFFGRLIDTYHFTICRPYIRTRTSSARRKRCSNPTTSTESSQRHQRNVHACATDRG